MKEYEANEVEHMRHKIWSSKNEQNKLVKNWIFHILGGVNAVAKSIHSILMSTKISTFHYNVC